MNEEFIERKRREGYSVSQLNRFLDDFFPKKEEDEDTN